MNAPILADGMPVIDIDPFDPEIIRNPYDFFATLRDAGPVVWLSKHQTYGVARFESVEAVFKDWEGFRSSGGAGLSDIRKPGAWREAGPIVEVDPPEHAPIRRAMIRIISPRVVRSWRETFALRARELCDEILARSDTMDGVSDFAEAFVLRVFPEALGIDVDTKNLVIVGDHNFNALGPQNSLFYESQAKLDKIADWYAQSQQRQALLPGGFGEMIFEAEENGDLPPGTASPMLRTFLRGGMDTTISGIGITLMYLSQNPLLWDTIKAEPQRLLNAFEEALRLESPVSTLFRTTSDEGASLAGYTLRPATKVQLFPGAANRDPRRWTEPDGFDLTRKFGLHTSFGFGVHNCIGRMLAQMEAECLIGELMKRVARIEPAGEHAFRPVNALRTLQTLPLRLVRE